MKRLLFALAAGMLIAGCATEPGKSQARLIETYWKALEVEGRTVEVKPGTREPHMVLRSDKNVVSGFSGCNNFRGMYEVNGDGLRFKGLASTMMACISGGDTEREFLSALNATATQRISGEILELRDQNGKVRARFESRYMK